MTDSFVPPTVDQVKVDMIFVVDNSRSMESHQDLIAKTFSGFITQFIKKGIDFHIGILTTDTDFNDNVPMIKRGKLVGSSNKERWFTRDTKNLVSKFTNTIQVGTSGSKSEQSLNSLLYGISAEQLAPGGYNTGFIRNDALLSTIVVSDEDEDITNNDATPAGRIARVAKRLTELKGTDSRGYRFDFVIDLNEPKPKDTITYPLPVGGITPYPNVYLQAAKRFASKTINIHNDFSRPLVEVGSDIIHQAQSEFKLSKLANPGTIQVTLNGIELVENSNDGFIFNVDRNTIELQGAALLKSPGSKLQIQYQVK